MNGYQILQLIQIISAIYIGRLIGSLLCNQYTGNFLIKFMFIIVVISVMYSSAILYSLDKTFMT